MIFEGYKPSAKTGLVTGLLLAILVFSGFVIVEAKTVKHLAVLGAENAAVRMLVRLDRLEEGTRHITAGEYERALPLLQQAAEDDPVNVVVLYNLGYAYYQLAMQSGDRTRAILLLEKSESIFQRVQSLNPELDVIYFKLGKIALLKGDDQRAAAYYRLGLEYDPANAALQFNLARVYDQMRDYDRAIEHYAQSVALDPEFKYAYNNMGLIYEMQGDKAAAEEAYLSALAKDPTYNFARLNLGNLYADMDRLDEARELYLQALKLEPDNAYAHLYLGNVYFMKADFESAIRHYRISAIQEPDNANTYYLLAIALSKLQRADEALEAGLQYMALDPGGRFSEEIRGLIRSLEAQLSRHLPTLRD